MDEERLKKSLQALQWEANYRKKAAQPASNHFLAPLTSLDADFENALIKLNIIKAKVLDIGTGTGEQAIFLAKRGFDVTATDVSASVLDSASKAATAHGVSVTFLEDNILSTRLIHQFDLIVDRGCFTILSSEHKKEYLQAAKRLLRVSGWLVLKADRKKQEYLTLFTEEPDFLTLEQTKSSYISENGKEIPAVVIIVQRIA